MLERSIKKPILSRLILIGEKIKQWRKLVDNSSSLPVQVLLMCNIASSI